jgi:hypothetical protein
MLTVAVGNSFDGIQLHGWFEGAEEASSWAERNVTDEDWHIVPINEVGNEV